MVSTPPVPPDQPDDADPTGIRALLSSLPDPGPMPSHLVDRINASIAAEQYGREHDDAVVPLHGRGRRWRRIGLVAAAAAVVAVAVPALLSGTGPGDVVASLKSQNSSADSAAGGAAPQQAPSSPEVATPGTTPDRGRVAGPQGAVTLVHSTTAYTSAGLAEQVAPLLAAKDFAAPAPAQGAQAASTNGLRGCLRSAGVQDWMPVTGDVATFDGVPAVVAVVSSDTGQVVYAVPADCTVEHPGVLYGPLPLP